MVWSVVVFVVIGVFGLVVFASYSCPNVAKSIIIQTGTSSQIYDDTIAYQISIRRCNLYVKKKCENRLIKSLPIENLPDHCIN